MAKENTTTAPLPTVPFAPVNLDAHEQERQAIRRQQVENLPRLLDCLDPTVAKSYEDRKPLYEWNVKCRLFRAAYGRQPAHMEELEKNVVAQNESDAWAMFCDAVGEWPSRRGCRPEIKQLRRRTLRDSSDQESDREMRG